MQLPYRWHVPCDVTPHREQATYRRRLLDDGGVGVDTVAAVQAGVQVWKELTK